MQPSQSSSSAAGSPSSTPRVIGPLAAICIVVGSTFGLGIFTGPPQTAQFIPTATLLMIIWVGSGLLALGGAFADGELAAMMPKAGGDYVFQRAAFGQSLAFASGWMLVTGVYAAGLAYMTVGLWQVELQPLLRRLGNASIDFSQPVLGPFTWTQIGASMTMILITLLNVWGTRQSSRVQTILTLGPLSIVALLAVCTLPLTPDPAAVQAVISTPRPEPTLTASNLAIAYLSVFFAYSGWNVAIYVGGEVKDPGRAIPRALIFGLLGITVLYALLCLSFVHALGMEGLRGVEEAGTTSATVFAGSRGGLVLNLLMAIALITATNGNTLTGGRIAYAMARDGSFWSPAGRLSSRRTPGVALWIQASLTIVMILTGTFNQLFQLCSIAMIMSGALNALAMFRLRRTQPHLPRPYRATGYPWIPAIYLISCVLAIGVVTWSAMFPEDPTKRDWYPLTGVGLLVIVWIGHTLWRRAKGPLAA